MNQQLQGIATLNPGLLGPKQWSIGSEDEVAASSKGSAIGFLGFGTINNAVAIGLLTSSNPPEKVIISARSASKAKALKDRFPDKVTIAEDNQELIDGSRLVFVAVLPGQAQEVLSSITFREEQRIVSLMGGISNEELNSMMPTILPQNIVCAVPLPPVKHHAGVTVIYPPDPEVVDMFNLLGTSVGVDDPDSMNKIPVMTCMMGSYYAYLNTCHEWLVENGVDSEAASTYVGAIMHSIASDGKKVGPNGFEELIEEQTPGGFNEMGIRELEEAGVWDEYKATLSSIAARWEGTTEPEDDTNEDAQVASSDSATSILSAQGLELLNSNPEAFEQALLQVKRSL